MNKLGDEAYLFGGANMEGARNDFYKFNLETLDFTKIKVNDKKVPLPHLEMHTAHIYNSD
jgi:hypothetical protein